ncbi:PAS domain-containing protein [Pontibacter rugosus]|uniref:histidine kinase n=1 Tax=Pontibacter rugosus TaxID=1745966 RepID=A0ABW3SQ62_9BACT
MINLLHTLPGNFLALTPDLQVVIASAGYTRLTGVEKQRLEGSLLPDVLPASFAKYCALVQDMATEAVASDEEVSRLFCGSLDAGASKLDQEPLWRMSCKQIVQAEGQVFLLYTVEDATGVHQGEEKERYRLLQEAGHLIVWDWDSKKQTTWRSDGFFSVLGIDRAAAQASDPGLWESLLHPNEAERVLKSIRGAFAEGDSEWQAEYRLRHASGRYITVADRAKVLYSNQGHPLRMVGTTIDVTEQREKELEARKLNQLLNSLPGIVWSSDAGGNITFVNQALRNLTGLSLEQVQQGEALDLVHPDDRGSLASLQDVCEAVFRVKAGKDGYRWYAGRSVPITDEDGKVVSRIGVCTDVHEQNLERLALRDISEKLQEMLDALPIMAWAAEPDGTYTYYNRCWWNHFETSDENWTLEQWAELMHPEDRNRTVEQWAESIAKGTPYSMKLRWRAHRAAPYRWFQAYSSPVKDADGNIRYWMGATIDIHEYEEAHALLEEKNTSFQFLADVMPHMVWRTDAHGFHNYFNRRWVEYTGYDVESSLGTEMWNNLLHPEDQEQAQRIWTHSLEAGEPYEIEYRFKRASDGAWRWFLARALPLRNAAGEIVQWYGTCTDIEDKKHTEQQLESQKQELESQKQELETINQDLDRFVHMIGHDLRLPLVNMGALFDALTENGCFDAADSEQLVRHYRKSHKAMTTTLSDLMELARLQKSAQGNTTQVNLRDAVDEVLESLGPLASSSHAEVSVQLDEPESILYSKANLRSILHNLFSNAIKYRHPDRRPQVEIKSSWQEGNLKLTISDNGLGIDLEKHGKRLFGAFNRLHSHTEGSGLGLYIVKRIVETKGGQISVSSKEGYGTTFTIKLKPMA